VQGFFNYLTYLNMIKSENVEDFTFHCTVGKLRHSFIFLFRGTADYYTGDGVIHLEAGEGIFLPIGAKYTSVFKGNGDIYYINLICLFSPDYPENNGITHILSIQKLIGCNASVSAEVERLYELFLSDRCNAAAQFYILYGRLLQTMAFTEKSSEPDLIGTAVEYLEKHFTESLSVGQLAELCSISEPYFYRLFKERFGFSPIEYRNRMRIRRAMDLLGGTDESVSSIGERLGFSTDEFFSRTFKRLVKKTPSEYRLQQRG